MARVSDELAAQIASSSSGLRYHDGYPDMDIEQIVALDLIDERRECRRFAANLLDARAENARLREELDLAIAHDRQPYPTADAYEKACAALGAKNAELARLRPTCDECNSRWEGHHYEGCPNGTHGPWIQGLETELARLREALEKIANVRGSKVVARRQRRT